MSKIRLEHDPLGKKEIPEDALYGIHTLRALENFPIANRQIHPSLVHAFGAVKLACAQTNHSLQPWKTPVFLAISSACEEMIRGCKQTPVNK